ncbi:MAG: hypothetical protein ACI4KI_04645 [Candidatus Fimenecus sp.]
MKKAIFKVTGIILNIFFFISGVFLIFAYWKLRNVDGALSPNSLIFVCEQLSYYVPSYLCAYYGYKYLKYVKGIPIKSIPELFKIVVYTCLFFAVGLMISYLLKFISEAIGMVYCLLAAFNEKTPLDYSDSFWCIFDCLFSSSVIIVIYQSIFEKHIYHDNKKSDTK